MRKIYLKKHTSSKELLDEVLRLNGIANYKLRYNEYGKPYLESGGLFFNLSHSGEYVACAISDKEIGIDTMCSGICQYPFHVRIVVF